MITDKKRKILSGTVIITFLVFCFVVGWFVGKPMLRFVEDYDGFKVWIEQSGFMGRVYFVLMVIFQVIIALVPGEPLEIAAGFAFGAIEGTILCVIGITVGSIIVFYLVRKFSISCQSGKFFSKYHIKFSLFHIFN